MRVAEQLTNIRQDEGELQRLFDLRDNIIQSDFSEELKGITSEITEDDVIKKKASFMKKKKLSLTKLAVKISELVEKIIDNKTELNRINLEAGLDKELLRLKYTNLNLSKIMRSIKGSRYSIRETVDSEAYTQLGIDQEIKDLEGDKKKATAAIQSHNWTAKIS